ncbi:MAG TPA: SIR2 family protein [Patescibacteria group bacterium]|jgi:hypothetical protein|nr:SIR2 family protein [Patescibacteria group bacterium]
MAIKEVKIQALGFSPNKQEIDESQLISHLGRTLQTHNLVVLSGAGSSILKDGSGKDLGGLTMPQLTEGLKKDAGFIAAVKASSGLDARVLDTIKNTDNIESLLSAIDSLLAADKVAGSSKQAELLGIKKSALEYMRSNCVITKGTHEFPHESFLKKLLTSRKLINPRIKVFTLNYDTLFEQAAQELDAILIDGFSFSQPRKFQGNNFDLDIVKRNHSRLHKEESYYSNVMHLYKLHGSVDWRLVDERIEQVDPDTITNVEDSVMVYPGSHKYQASYSMPFYEMISRFQSTVRETNTTLLIIGYSFGDDHINRIILEAAASNLGLSIYIISPSAADMSSTKNSEILKNIQKQINEQEVKNVFCVSQDFKNFTKVLPHYGNGSPYELEQTNKQIDEAITRAGGAKSEEDIPF